MMSSWRSGSRSPAATWRRMEWSTVSFHHYNFNCLEDIVPKQLIPPVSPWAATPPGQFQWSSQTQDAPPAAWCSFPWSKSYAEHPLWTPPYLHHSTHSIVEMHCVYWLGKTRCLTCPYVVYSFGCSNCCFSKFPSNLRTNTRLKK